MRPIESLSHAEVMGLFRYDPNTGFIWWKNPTTPRRRRVPVGTLAPNGYVQINCKGMRCGAHRLIWFMVKGVWPAAQIDHKNRIRNDNRWVNLREATSAQNKANGSVRVDNKLGIRGVTKEASGKFRAQIQVNKKKLHLGEFLTRAEAISAYSQAARRHFGEFAV